jgi:hypothetical protein
MHIGIFISGSIALHLSQKRNIPFTFKRKRISIGAMISEPMTDGIVVRGEKQVIQNIPQGMLLFLVYPGLDNLRQTGFRGKMVEAISFVRDNEKDRAILLQDGLKITQMR